MNANQYLQPIYYFDFASFAHASLFDHCTFVWEVLPKIQEYLEQQPLGKIEVEIPQGVYLIDSHLISIGKGTKIDPGVYIKGPCLIGENCTIRHGAYIRGNLITGNHCVIGHDTEIKNCVLLNHVHAAHFAYLGDSILGNSVNLGAGAKLANLKLDESQVIVHCDTKRIPTGLKKFGAICGDFVRLGCNCVTNPGTLLGKGVRSYPCTNFGGFIPSNHIIKPETTVVISAYN